MTVISITRHPVVAIVSRSWTCGGDLYHDGRLTDLETAEGLVLAWRKEAAKDALYPRLSDTWLRAANDLEQAMNEARAWRRCWRGLAALPKSPEPPEDIIA